MLELQDADIKEKVIEAVNGIVSEKTFDTLINTCGYNSLLNELSDVCGDGTHYINKTDLDNAFVEKIHKKLKSEIERKKASIAAKRKIEEENKLIEKETALVKAKKTRNGIIAALLIMTALVTGIITFTVIIPNIKYDNALHLIDIGEYENAINAFIDLNGYRDSSDKIIEAKYLYADNMVASGNYYGAKEIYENISDYKDSSDQISYCDYNIAMSLMNDNKYDEAMLAFDKISGYSDSVDQIKECKYRQASEFINNSKYDNAMELLNGIKSYKNSEDLLYECKLNKAKSQIAYEQYDDAISLLSSLSDNSKYSNDIIECKYELALKLMETQRFTDASKLLYQIEGYCDSSDYILECQYQEATVFIKDHNYQMAINYLRNITDYKDSSELLEKCEEDQIIEQLKYISSALSGDIIEFGVYEDNIIRWKVVEKTDDTLLLITDNAIENKPIISHNASTNWKTSLIRTWLNEAFFDTAFTNRQKELLLSSNNNIDNAKTQDYLFLPTDNDIKTYWGKFVLSTTNKNGWACSWWLSSTGNNRMPQYIDMTGKMQTASGFVYDIKPNDELGVRPMMRIKKSLN